MQNFKIERAKDWKSFYFKEEKKSKKLVRKKSRKNNNERIVISYLDLDLDLFLLENNFIRDLGNFVPDLCLNCH